MTCILIVEACRMEFAISFCLRTLNVQTSPLVNHQRLLVYTTTTQNMKVPAVSLRSSRWVSFACLVRCNVSHLRLFFAFFSFLFLEASCDRATASPEEPGSLILKSISLQQLLSISAILRTWYARIPETAIMARTLPCTPCPPYPPPDMHRLEKGLARQTI